ncbi:MAG TPA: sensor histidine kinase [Gammaproteobacteria bacterium]|nr:sensor histidine kinase [Gammaproteobacteria bacterium]
MPLSDYIAKHAKPIVADWAAFARQHVPAAQRLQDRDLIGPARTILGAIASSLDEEAQAPAEPIGAAPSTIAEAAQVHGARRLGQSFTLDQMIAEYRVLRTSVVRDWTKSTRLAHADAIEQLTRFDTVVDHTSTETIKWFYGRVERGRDMLVAVLAHDVRTPLGAILASVDVLLHAGDLEGPALDSARQIRHSAMRLRLLANDLLDFTRTRLGSALPVAPEPLDFGDVCGRTVAELESLHSSAAVEVDCAGDLRGSWDPARLEQMLSNLITNAIEHGTRGEPILVTARGPPGPEIEIEVENSGPPIPAHVRHVMLDPLKHLPVLEPQLDGRTRGLGLGVFIARLIAEAHSGKIEFDSSREDRTIVRVRLPRAKPEPTAGSSTPANGTKEERKK